MFTDWCKSESRIKMKRTEFLDLIEEYYPNIDERKRVRITESWYCT